MWIYHSFLLFKSLRNHRMRQKKRNNDWRKSECIFVKHSIICLQCLRIYFFFPSFFLYASLSLPVINIYWEETIKNRNTSIKRFWEKWYSYSIDTCFAVFYSSCILLKNQQYFMNFYLTLLLIRWGCNYNASLTNNALAKKWMSDAHMLIGIFCPNNKLTVYKPAR
jgi:hypothetical protein